MAGSKQSLPKADRSRVLLGTITGAHGIRGDVVVHSYTAEPEAIAAYGPLSDAAGARSFKLRVLNVMPKGVIVRIAGVEDRNAAEALQGTDLYVARAKLPKTETPEFYHADLIGLEARDTSGKRTGEIVNVANFGAGDLLEIKFDGAKDTELIPFSEACVPDVEIAGGYAVIVPPLMTGEPEPAGEED